MMISKYTAWLKTYFIAEELIDLEYSFAMLVNVIISYNI